MSLIATPRVSGDNAADLVSSKDERTRKDIANLVGLVAGSKNISAEELVHKAAVIAEAEGNMSGMQICRHVFKEVTDPRRRYMISNPAYDWLIKTFGEK